MASRTKEYENMSLEELKEVAVYPYSMKEFMDAQLYNNPTIKTPPMMCGLWIDKSMDIWKVMWVTQNTVIGILTIEMGEIKHSDIHAIAIHPYYRKRGIAKQLIGEAIKLGATRFYGTISPDIVKYVWWFYHEQWRF